VISVLRPPATRELLNGWPTRRFELMRTRVADLELSLAGSVFDPVIARVRRDLERRGLTWFPEVYLSSGWHCPDKVPIVGVPFTLASPELRRVEREVTKELETPAEMVRLLRHEVGHAYNYALGLFETREWRETFGPFSQPYREKYRVRPRSKDYVLHLRHHYAQKHPDEDFAETFAVWLLPRREWRDAFAGWGAMRKLEYVDGVMTEHRGFVPSHVAKGPLVDPLESLEHTVAQHYQRRGYDVNGYGFQDEAAAYVDEDLRRVFVGRRVGGPFRADAALRRLRKRIVAQVIGLLHVRPEQAEQLYDKYVERARLLGIETGRDAEPRLLVNVATMMTTHLLNRRHTGRFTRQSRLVSCR
jgi:hypothetical protein